MSFANSRFQARIATTTNKCATHIFEAAVAEENALTELRNLELRIQAEVLKAAEGADCSE